MTRPKLAWQTHMEVIEELEEILHRLVDVSTQVIVAYAKASRPYKRAEAAVKSLGLLLDALDTAIEREYPLLAPLPTT